ncbi:MAG: hypothetical protein WBK51_07555, partial [Polaromonas sp.]
LFLALIADFVDVSAEKYRHQGKFIRCPRLTLWEVPVIGLEAYLTSNNRPKKAFSALEKQKRGQAAFFNVSSALKQPEAGKNLLHLGFFAQVLLVRA